jgi:DNA-binding protein HU-beta
MLEALAQDSWTIPACMMYEPSSNRRALHFGYFELTDCRHGWRIYSVVAKKSVAVKKVVDVAKREKGASVKVTSVKPSASKAAEALFSNMIEIIIKHLKKGAKVRISGIGILQVKKRAARMGRNPATGESMKIKPSKKVSLRVAQDLKAKI